MQMIFDTSAIEQTHGFALCLRSWWMEARDIPAGLRQSVTSLVYKLCTDMLFQRETCVLNPFYGQKTKENFFPTGSREDRS